jgi:hypothetical protein
MLLMSGPALADSFSVAPQVGTLGIGLNLGYQVNDHLKFRANVNYLPFSRNQSIEDISYKIDLRNVYAGGLVDAHVFANNFRVTGGLYYVDMSLKAKGKLNAAKTYKIGDHEYSGLDLGTWKGTVDWKKLAPYIGIGYGSGAGSDSGLSFSGDLGIMYIGKPKVRLNPAASAYEAASNYGYDLHDDVRREENNVKKSISDTIKIWPVISLGVCYRF